jgi:uncharacterized protein (DUF305 family)
MDQKTLVVGGGALLLGVALGMLLLPWVHHGGEHRMHGDYHERYEKSEKSAKETMMNHDAHSMDAMMDDMMRALDGKTGAEFDAVFLREMIIHHEGAVEMAKAALVQAQDQRIKDLATAIIAAQEKEIADMQSWQQSAE